MDRRSQNAIGGVHRPSKDSPADASAVLLGQERGLSGPRPAEPAVRPG